MKQYIFVSNWQKDVKYQYNDFFHEDYLYLNFIKFTRVRLYFIRVLQKFHLDTSRFIYDFFYKKIFSKEIQLKEEMEEKEPYVFILTGMIYEEYGSQLVRYIREQYSGSYIVLYLIDLLYKKSFTADAAKKDFDLVCSFDKKEAEKYKLGYLLEPFSFNLLKGLSDVNIPEYDVTFVGHAKNRYDNIISLYEALRANGFKCDFRITGVPKSKRKYPGEICYQWTDFEELLMHVKKSRCVLELMQKEGYSATTRYAEAMLLGKNLLTNCRAFEEEENKEKNIFYFNNIQEIPFEKLKSIHKYDMEKYKEKFSIQSFIKSLDEMIEKNMIVEDKND